MILDHRGQPVQLKPPARRAQMLNNPANIPYDSADIFGSHMEAWRPFLWSPDTELNMYRDRIVSRVRDAVRNDGWATGIITRILDTAIGANFRPVSKPDYRMLQQKTGLKTFDAQWAHEHGRAVDAHFRSWANDPGKWCDIERGLNFSMLQYLGFRHKLIDGDALAMMRWEPSRMGPGRATYCTAVQMIDPDRLSNVMKMYDQEDCRGGVWLDRFGAAVAYSIQEAHQGDWYNAAKSLTWKKIPRETSWGRPIIVHDFDHDRASQHRGGAGILSPVLQRLKMLIKYDGAELDAALLNAVFSAYIESPFDHSLLGDALGEEVNTIGAYQNGRAQFHDERKIMMGSAVIPTLYPGEKINTMDAARPSSNYPAFEAAVMRNLAAGTGLSAQQVSNNWSDVNYSSARAAMIEAWSTMDRRRAAYTVGFSHQMFTCWAEESFDSDDYPDLPNGAPEFHECRAAYARARWIGPAKGWVDPVAEREGVWLGLEIGTSNLEDECAEQGIDMMDNLDELEIERKAFEERGLNRPSWAGSSGKTTASKEAAKPGGDDAATMPTAPKVRKEST